MILSFEGAEQAIYVWINGEFVGYAEDSFTVSEFDITPYVKKPEIVCVWRYINEVRRLFWKTRTFSGSLDCSEM